MKNKPPELEALAEQARGCHRGDQDFLSYDVPLQSSMLLQMTPILSSKSGTRQ